MNFEARHDHLFHLQSEIYNYIILMFDSDEPYLECTSMQSVLTCYLTFY